MRRLLYPLLPAVAAAGAYFLYIGDGNQAGENVRGIAIESDGGTHRFKAELALTPERRRRGLMHRRELAPDAGMLFVFDPPGVQAMWMQDTPLSLDMLFFDDGGALLSVARDTVPHSPRQILSPPDTRYVLELRAGTARRLGLRPGARLLEPPALPEPRPAPAADRDRSVAPPP